ncbi:MAG: RnfABCDGE type electron transport complex subunit D [Woeseiaceae bacterium]|nr:RnfABCDGE type electron transport complex subunit D [Woeseiaceae bacterium]
MSPRIPFIDPRYYQIAVLSTLVVYGTTTLGFGIHWENALSIVVVALATQYLGTVLLTRSSFDPLSAIITSLSLTLLFRTDVALLAALAGFIAIASKFVIRVRGKHVFNPANIAIVSLMFSSDRAWISSGQWGSTTISAVLLIGLGLLVLTRAKRAETTIGFLVAFSSLLLARAVWLGDPMSIPLHQLQNGALLVFAFFMISDPKTTPDTATGRWCYAALVAALAYVIQFVFFIPNGAVIALAFAAPLVPLIDLLSKGLHYQWRPSTAISQTSKGVSNA